MNKLYVSSDADTGEVQNFREIVIPAEIQFNLELLIGGISNLTRSMADLFITFNLLAKNSQFFMDQYYSNIILPERYYRYSWICSGILLVSLGLFLLFALLVR